jgi:hypothetical protein
LPNHHASPGIFQNESDFPGREPVIQGAQDRAYDRCREIGLQEIVTILVAYGHPVTFSNTFTLQARGKPGNPLHKIPVGESIFAAHHTNLIRVQPIHPFKQRPQIHMFFLILSS